MSANDPIEGEPTIDFKLTRSDANFILFALGSVAAVAVVLDKDFDLAKQTMRIGKKLGLQVDPKLTR